jgi:hypothetical protein
MIANIINFVGEVINIIIIIISSIYDKIKILIEQSRKLIFPFFI